jgi:phospholipid/cholesterol/gamma-HCH transport system substrate-binding protein
VKRAIRTHLTDFVAILVLLVLSVGVAGYILTKERLRLPFIAPSEYTLNAAFQTAQAVTPGQGQSVRVSGVQIGEIGPVTLKNGVAIVQMDIQTKYRHLIHTNASALLRPRTGLKDMFIELDPGTAPAPVARPGYTIPVSNTMPDVDTDEILASLDSDTRAYLELLVNGAGQGLKGNGGSELAQVFEKFLPTHRDLARLNQAVAVRGRDLQQLVNSLARLNGALAQKQTQIVQLVDASEGVFSALASDNQDISRAVADLPATLRQTTETLGKVQRLATVLGPASTSLIPFAREIPAANAALTSLAVPSTPIVANQIRPFVVAARPVVRSLRPASVNLAKATPNLATTFNVLNHLFNLLGYYPSNGHGYLWWLAWLDHNARTLFSIQDANGDYRPLFLQLSCASLTQLAANEGPTAVAVLNLTPILSDAGLCPQSAGNLQAAYDLYKQGKLSGSSSRAAGVSDSKVTFFPDLSKAPKAK